MIDRAKFIGGSDIASVMGLSPWKSALQLWAEKTGKIQPDDLSNNEAVELGTELEDFVAKKFERKTGLKVRRSPKYYVHKDYPHFRAQVDRLVQGTDELLECKTTSAWKEKEWDGEDIPEHYICQVMWQLGITGRKVGHIAVLIGGQKFRYKKIEFDQELFDAQIEAANKFWDCVQTDTQPEAVGLDNSFIVDLYPDNNDQIQQMDEFNARIALLMQLKNTISETIQQKEEIEAGIKQVIGENLGITTPEYQVTWKTQLGNRVDVQALKDAKIYDQYVYPTKTRVLRVKKNKEN